MDSTFQALLDLAGISDCTSVVQEKEGVVKWRIASEVENIASSCNLGESGRNSLIM